MRIAVAGATGLTGTELVRQATRRGYDVVPISRRDGIDLTGDGDLSGVLDGVEAVIDVTNAPATDRTAATTFFEAVARRLGEAAGAAGVPRTVLLSIIGVDRADEDYYLAKLAHERATVAHAPGVRVLRAAQFHDFPGQLLGWSRTGDTAAIPDIDCQPVSLTEVATLLLDLAAEPDGPALVELAGPRPERMLDLVARLLASRGERLELTPVPPGPAVRDGALLPGPDARLAGPTYDDWLAAGGR